MSETQTLTAARVPTVYFIDDSATMREVIKIAFRKENIHVVTCADAASALAQFAETAPDAVITDVIMPDKDGYEVCQFVRQHERLGEDSGDSDVGDREPVGGRKSDDREGGRINSKALPAPGFDCAGEGIDWREASRTPGQRQRYCNAILPPAGGGAQRSVFDKPGRAATCASRPSAEGRACHQSRSSTH